MPHNQCTIWSRTRLGGDLCKGRKFHGRTVNYRKDGSEFLMEWTVTPIKNDKDEITHFLAVQHEA